MAKKKGKKGKQDARGYSTTAIVTKTIEIPATTNITDSECSDTCLDADNVTVSSTQFARTDINERECSDQFLDIEKLTVSSMPSTNISANNNKTSRAFFKRIENLFDRLLECKFKEDQIRNAVSGLVLESNLPSMSNTKSNTSPFNLDDALDWLCSNTPPDDLPPLFRDDSFHNPNPKDASAIEAFLTKPPEKSVPPNITLMGQSANQLSIQKANSLKNVEKNATVHENKEWILNKFQFEVDEGEIPGNSNCLQTVTTCHIGPSTSELRMLELERSIDALKADVNDDAANYMRSKFEVKDLKNQLSTLTKQYQKLKASIAKSKTKLDKRLHNSEEDETDYLHFPESESEVKDSSDLGVEGLCTVSDQDITSAVDFVSRISQDHSREIASNVDLEILKNAKPLIPKGWTGTTPAKELEIWCRRQGFPHPVFSKKLDSNFNLQIKSKPNELKIQFDASFESRDHAQEYLSLVALYRISPDRSLQHVLPPVFAELWKSWHRKKEEVRLIGKAGERNAKDEIIQGLIALIPKHLQVGGGIEAMEVYPQNLDLYHHAPSVVKNVAGSLETQMKTRNNECSQTLMLEFETRKSCTAYKKMESSRRQLPIFAYKEEFLDVYVKNRVTVLCAETGAGKTTQIPQFILEQSLTNGRGNEIGIICTQPRRISAISVAERVAEEMCVNIGDIVGYQIKGEASKSRRTKLLYCTTGIILRRLQDDPELSGVTTVILDEVHERSWQIDFLLVALRKLVFSSRSDLKIVLMSATLDADLFSSFFDTAPVVKVPGRSFPVEIYHLEDLLDATDHAIDENSYYNRNGWRKNETMEQVWITTKAGERRCEFVDVDYQTETSQISGYYAGYKTSTQRSMERVSEQNLNYDLLEDTLLLLSSADNQVLLTPSKKSLSSGAFLIFLPGIAEIKAMMDRLENHRVFSDRKKFDLIPLHSSLSSQHQRRAFAASRSGCRKVLLATNIAETSVTIPDVVCVIDCGLVREIRYDKRYATTKLVLDWCSKASIKQRSGRAGRVQEGICCRLYSSRTANHVMKDHSTPELQRMALEDVCVSILAGKLSRNCSDFLMQAPQPPPADAISLAIRILHEVGILSFANNQEILTPLGLHVAKIPVDFRLAKMLIFAVLFKCMDPILSIVGSLSAKSPFALALTNNVEAQAAHRKFQHNTSDFIALVNVWNGFIVAFNESKDRGRGFCRKNFINWSVMMEVYESKRQNLDLLCKIGFVQGDLRSLKDLECNEYNANGKDENVIHAIIFSGLYPNVAQVCKSGIQDLPLLWHKKEQLHFHPSSINCKKKVLTSNWIVFHEKFSTNRTSLSVTCPIHPNTIILFGGSIVVKYLERKVLVDEWIELDIAAHTGVMLRKLRYELDRSLSSSIESIDTRSCHDMAEKIVKLLQEG